ncbi:MAG: GC-type dockerin domain-anchored protein [Phycisphaerales bacterium]
MSKVAVSSLCVAALAGTSLATPPVFTQLPSYPSIQVIGLYVSDDGRTCTGFLQGNSNFIYRASGVPTMYETVSGSGSGAAATGVFSSVAGMNSTGSRFLFGYRDPNISSSAVYTGGLSNCAIYENGVFTVIPPPAIAQGCDQSIVSPRTLSGDGTTVIGSVWNTCRVAPFAWTQATGWTAWATQDTFPPFGQTGYQSHQVTDVSRNGSLGCGWYQSGNGYGGRTALVWTNNGQTVSRLDAEPHSVLWGQADAVSADGTYVAGSCVPPELLPAGENPQYGNKYLYRWSAATGVQVLPGKVDTMPGSMRHPNVNGITSNGRMIVGQDAFGGDREAFIWTPETGGIKLSDYLLARGLDLANQHFVTLTSAAGMSSDGRYITGQWMDFGGSIGPYIIDLGQQQCNAADMGSQGGQTGGDMHLDNNDFIVFINMFFAGNPMADLGQQGGLPGSDGAYDNNDFIAFISIFFTGCND